MCERDRFLRKTSKSSGNSKDGICEDDGNNDDGDDDGFSRLFVLKIKSGASLELASTREPKRNEAIGAFNGRKFELISRLAGDATRGKP